MNNRLIGGIVRPSKPGVLKPNRDSNESVSLNLQPARLKDIIEGKKKISVCVHRDRGGIGDVLMITPTCLGYKEMFPGCHLTFAVDPSYLNGSLKDILLNNPFIDKIENSKAVREAGFDIFSRMTCPCVALEQPKSTPPSRMEIFAEHAGVSPSSYLPIYVVTDEEQKWAKKFIEKIGITKSPSRIIIGVQANSSTDRRDPDINVIKRSIAKITNEYPNAFIIVFTYSNKYKTRWSFDRVTEMKDYSIRQVAAVINECHMVIVPDSSLLHVAGALEKPGVAIFGPTYAPSRVSLYKNIIAIEGGKRLACYPCWYGNCQSAMACMRTFNEDTIFDLTKNILGKLGKISVGYKQEVKTLQIATDLIKADIL